MTTLELARDFTSMLKRHDHDGASAKYHADDIVSHEAMEGPMAVSRGKAAVKAKGEWWQANHEVHGGTVEGPYVNGDQFVVRFTLDITAKESGQRPPPAWRGSPLDLAYPPLESAENFPAHAQGA